MPFDDLVHQAGQRTATCGDRLKYDEAVAVCFERTLDAVDLAANAFDPQQQFRAVTSCVSHARSILEGGILRTARAELSVEVADRAGEAPGASRVPA